MFEVSKQDYPKGKYNMPDRNDKGVSPAKKKKREYCLAFIRSVYTDYLNGNTFISSDLYNKVSLYRSYAYGKQDQTQYEEQLFGRAESGGIVLDGVEGKKRRRRAYVNINTQIMSPMPKIMDAIVNKLGANVNIVSVDAMDKYSGAVKETIKWGTYVDGKFKNMFASLRAMVGLPQDEPGYVPENVEELNLYDAEGGFKLNYAIAMEMLLKNVFTDSRWDENIQDRVLFDLAVNGFALVENVYDKKTGRVKIKYLDPQYAGVQYNKESGYNKPDYGFYISFEKISDLRQKGFSEDELKTFAKNYDGKYGNPSIDDWNRDNKVTADSFSAFYDSYLVPVFHVRWIDLLHEKEVQHETKYGRKVTYPMDEKTKLGKRDTELTTSVKVVMGGSWIMDSDYLYDYGMMDVQPRDGTAEVELPIHAVKVVGKPLMARLIPALDMFQNAWLKMQQGIAMASLNGFSIELGAIENLNLGNKKLTPLEIIKMWRQTGILFRRDKNVQTLGYSQSRTIEPIAGGAGNVMAEARDSMALALKLIEDLTGIDPIWLGATPAPDTGKAVTEFSMSATNDILSGILKQTNILKSDSARASCLLLQAVIRQHEVAKKAYSGVIGETNLELLKIAEGHDVMYGIRTRVRPTEQEIRDLVEMVNLSLKNGRDGKVGITEADAVRFKAMIQEGHSLKRVAQLLEFANRKAQQKAQEKEMLMMEENRKTQQEGLMLQAQIAEQTKMLEVRGQALISDKDTTNKLILAAYEKGALPFDAAMRLLSPQPAQPQPQQPQIQGQQQLEQPAGQPVSPVGDEGF